MTRKIILIGGMPTVGKSSIAKDLSEKLGLPWISTDQIREIMKAALTNNSSSILNNSVGMAADEYFKKFSPKEIAKKEYEQGEATWPGIMAMIHNDWTWREGLIIEGVNILPNLVAEEMKKNKNISAIFLTEQNVEKTRKVVYERGLFGNASSYSDIYKAKEIEWVKLFDDKIRETAILNSLTVFNVSKDKSDAVKLLEIIKTKF